MTPARAQHTLDEGKDQGLGVGSRKVSRVWPLAQLREGWTEFPNCVPEDVNICVKVNKRGAGLKTFGKLLSIALTWKFTCIFAY